MLCKTTAYVNLENIEHNVELIRSKIKPNTRIMAAVKGDAYGHGAVAVSSCLYKIGVKDFAVACVDEALSIRASVPDCNILILGFTHPSLAPVLSKNKIVQAVYSLEYANLLSQSCKKNNLNVDVHLAIETGMGRIGFSDSDSAVAACKLEGLNVKGAFTHFSCADMTEKEDIEFTKGQYSKFIKITGDIEKAGFELETKHCSNSAAIFKYPQFQLDMVRAGIIIYGLSPNPQDKETYGELKPALRLKSLISHIKTVEKGDTIGYGASFKADREMRIATVPCGYADGYCRSFGEGYALVCGKRAKIVGRICMDQFMMDVSDIPEAEILSDVTLLGRDGNEEITADELAKLDETINYEIICGISKRVIRVYE